MTSRSGPVARARRIADEDEARVLSDLLRARQSAGLSRAEVSRRSGRARSAVERLERRSRRSTLTELASIGAIVGLDVRLKAYPTGDAIRDAGQLRLIDRLRREIHPSLRWRTEVPLPIPGDLRAWDAVILGRGWQIAVEAETVLADIQAVTRKVELKRRDGAIDHVLLLVADTTMNRRAMRSASAGLSDFRLSTRDVLTALRAGRDPGGSGIVVR